MNLPCPRCQHSNPPDSPACLACGEPLTADSHPSVPSLPNSPEPPAKRGAGTWTAIALICALAGAGVAYRVLEGHKLTQSAALFIGIPTLLSVLLVLLPKPKSFTGIILKGISLALLLSGPLLGEGFICILMVSPLFLLVGLIVGGSIDWARKRDSKNAAKARRLRLIIPVPVLLLMSLEGTRPELSFSRMETVSVTRLVDAPVSEVELALKRAPRFETVPPGVLGIGFPIPLGGSGSELTLGSRSVVHFSGGEGRPPGDLTLEVTERRDGFARFSARSDTSHINHWLRWVDSEVSWAAAGPGQTEVTWTIHFERSLDPAWYFGWPERMVVERCAHYLLQTCATP